MDKPKIARTTRQIAQTARQIDGRRLQLGRLESAEDQVELLVPQILLQLQTETLRSVKPEHIASVQSSFEAWMAAGGAQKGSKFGSQGDRAGGEALLKQMRPLVREIKICIDGEFPYDGHDASGVPFTTTRKLFHLAEKRPFVSNPPRG